MIIDDQFLFIIFLLPFLFFLRLKDGNSNANVNCKMYMRVLLYIKRIYFIFSDSIRRIIAEIETRKLFRNMYLIVFLLKSIRTSNTYQITYCFLLIVNLILKFINQLYFLFLFPFYFCNKRFFDL